LSKVDLLPHLDFDLAAAEDALGRVMPAAKMLRASARTGEGIEELLGWLLARRIQRVA
jgi:hydrogenase nickel incorporation protein HypB